jgi:hypothetical protein
MEKSSVAAGPLEASAVPQEYEWATTSPNPRHPGTGYDAGTKGWRLHLIPKDRPEYWYSGKYKAPALCGVRARHGWGLDLFIDEPCKRCNAIAAKRGIETPDCPA